MKKSLKKVISAVAALALSTSSFVALAADFPDVAATADYAKAVDQLTGMKIVEGREDGNFDPDAAVTRAEMTAMIIRALGSEAAAVSMAGRDTVFTDVDHNHWAAGYVAVANTINPQFVQGMGDGTFAPNATVTYAQAVTMLVRALGYESIAAKGRYPNGYLAQAGSMGMLDGFTIPGNDTELNRGQVAILIDNATVNCPILGEGEWQQTLMGSGYAPEVKDGPIPGASNFWKSLATSRHDVYQVFGRVTGTKQTGYTNEADEVQVTIMRSKNFDGFSYGLGYDSNVSKTPRVTVGETDAAEHLNEYAEFLIQDLNDDEYVILSYTPTDGRTQSDTFDSNQFVKLTSTAITFDQNGSNERDYRLNQSGVNWYVNGYPMTSWTQDDVDRYLTNNFVGDVTLIDYVSADGSQGADGRYDDIMVTYYQDAVVDEVMTTNSGVSTINFIAQADGMRDGSFKIDPEDDDQTVVFKGDATSVEELEQYDVLSIQGQPGATLANSNNVTITVSKQEATGVISKTGTNEQTNTKEYTLPDGDYTINGDLEASLEIPENGSEYTFKLDAFGYISYIIVGESSKNYGIIDGMFTADGGASYRVRMILDDGSSATYDYYKQNLSDFEAAALKYAYNTFSAAQNTGDLKPVQDRVVNYNVIDNQKIRFTNTTVLDGQLGDTTYQLSANRVGSVRMTDATKALDLTEYCDIDGKRVGSVGDVEVMGSFQADSDYKVYGYGKSNSDSTYRFVIVLDGAGGIGMDSPLAVVSSSSEADYGDGPVVQLSVLTNGELVDLIYDSTVGNADDAVVNALGIGDVFVYELGADNTIRDLKLVYDSPASTYGQDAYAAYVNKLFTDAKGHLDVADGSSFDCEIDPSVPTATTYTDTTKFGTSWNKGRGDYAFFTFGPVLSTTGGVTIGSLTKYNDEVVSLMDVDTDYSFDAEYNVYTIDWTQRYSEKKLGLGSRSSIQRSNISNTILNQNTTTDGNRFVPWDRVYHVDSASLSGDAYNQTAVSFALLKLYGDSITEGYSLIAPR